MHVKEAFATWHFSIILISLRSRSGADYRFFSTSCALKSFSQLKFTTLYTGQIRRRSYFFYFLLDRACSEVAAFLQTAGAHHISNVF